jgi:hypothetical protein
MDGTILHRTLSEFNEISEVVTNDLLFELPDKYQEEAERGTEINLRMDQLRILDYWARVGQTALVGVSLPVENHMVEYRTPMTIDPIAEEPLDKYLTNLHSQWQATIREMSPCIAQCFANPPMNFTFKMRYLENTLRVWFTPEEVAAAGLDKPLAEAPVAKYLWVANEARVLTYPSMIDEVAAGSAHLLFGGELYGDRFPNPEIAGSQITLIA